MTDVVHARTDEGFVDLGACCVGQELGVVRVVGAAKDGFLDLVHVDLNDVRVFGVFVGFEQVRRSQLGFDFLDAARQRAGVGVTIGNHVLHQYDVGLQVFLDRLLVEFAAEGFGHGAPHHQSAVVLQNHDHVVAQVTGQTLAFLQTQGQTFLLVVGHFAVKHHGVLAQRQQFALEHGQGHACSGAQVQHAVGIIARHVNGAVDHKTRKVHIVGTGTDLLALGIDLDKAGGGDFVERPAIGVDQVMRGARHT